MPSSRETQQQILWPDSHSVAEERTEAHLSNPNTSRVLAPSRNDFVNMGPLASATRFSRFQSSAPEQFVEADVAAEFLHYSPRSVKQMARDGRIPAHPFGDGPRKRWYFLISELAEHLGAQVNSAHGEAGRDKTQRRVI
jgi:Helix-turn-helix domain